jgi:hypothetical protein
VKDLKIQKITVHYYARVEEFMKDWMLKVAKRLEISRILIAFRNIQKR